MRAILIEDSEDDAFLLGRALNDGGVFAELHRVETLSEFKGLLEIGGFSFVISDYALPQFSVPDALQEVRRRNLDIPFIVVSGRYGEEKAVETMRAGAQDYVPKDRLMRLAPAVMREVKEAQFRQERRELERILGVSDPLRLFGRLAGSLAHELSNPLTLMHGGLSLLNQRLLALSRAEDGHHAGSLQDLRTLVDKLIASAERIGRITADFRALGAAEDEVAQPADINLLVEHCVKVVQLEFRRRSQVLWELGDLPICQVKVGRFKQAVVNILVYVAQLFPLVARGASGEVCIRTVTAKPGGVRIEFMLRGASKLPSLEGAALSEGSDYGLFIGRRILETIGGHLTIAQEAEGVGCLRLDLPCLLEALDQGAEEAPPPALDRLAVALI